MQQVVDRLRQADALDETADADLVGAFVARRCESAFAELVRRHGPMVWGVCRRLVRQQQDAEDCYQATFLVLMRKAASIHPRGRVGAWLHGVAYHTALKARAVAAKRGHMEKQVLTMPDPLEAKVGDTMSELLDRELQPHESPFMPAGISVT